MADLSDVEGAIADRLVTALYPLGPSGISIVGVECRVYRGWPAPAALNSDLTAGVVNVTIFPAIAPDEIPPPYFDVLYTTSSSAALTAAVTGTNVTLSGIVNSNQVIGLLIDGKPYTYNVSGSDTVQSVAANLGALVNVDRVTAVLGSTLTIPDTITLVARVITDATVSRCLRRQRKEIHVTCWCPSFTLRDSVCSAVDLAMSTTPFIDIADGTKAHICYMCTKVYDQSQNALLYRRDLCYKCEYSVITTSKAPVMLFGDVMRNGIEMIT